jgi:hypothetical protein
MAGGAPAPETGIFLGLADGSRGAVRREDGAAPNPRAGADFAPDRPPWARRQRRLG